MLLIYLAFSSFQQNRYMGADYHPISPIFKEGAKNVCFEQILLNRYI